MVVICLLCLLSNGLTAGLSQAATKAPADEVIEIDGKKDPSLIPEWLTWEQGFVVLAGWQGRDSAFNHDLKEALSAEEFDAFEREAAAQSGRQAKAEQEGAALRSVYGNSDPKDPLVIEALNQKLVDINLRYRRSVLDARDRVLRALRPESESVVLAWIGDIRSGITSRVPKGELRQWRAPE